MVSFRAEPPPVDDPGDEDIVISAPADHAAGLEAVGVSLRMGVEQMGAFRTARTLLRLNQPDGFDCPGCAWPEPHKTKTAEFCENGAKAVAEEATTRRIERDFFKAHSVEELATRSDWWLGQQGRLTEPMVKRPGATHYSPISWDDAFALIGTELDALASPDEALFYTSGRTSNEAAFLYQLFVRAFGTNNLPDCSNMCHESSGAALAETIGMGKGSVLIDDLPKADLIIVMGQNPGTNHPRMLTALAEAKKAGARIMAINPLPEAGLLRFDDPQSAKGLVGRSPALADRFLQIKVNGDLALFKALNHLFIEIDRSSRPGARGKSVIDHTFIADHTDGFDAFAKDTAELSWADVLEATGLTRDEITAAAAEIGTASRIIVCWAMGLTQHRNSVATIREVVNLLLLRGSIGKPGAGVCPVRGHSNVQGDRTMGIWEKMPAAFLDRLGDEFGFEPPRHDGHDTVDAIRAMRDGEARVFIGMGGNFASATPDRDVTAAALRQCRLTAHVSTKLNRSHTVTGEIALILPTLGRTERDTQAGGDQFVTVEDSMGMVHRSHGRLAPASNRLRSEAAIVAGMARATEAVGLRAPAIAWSSLVADYGRVRDRIAAVVPGFEDFNERVQVPGGFALPHPPRDTRTFPTETGLARFTVNELDVLRVPAGRLLLQTIRSHDQYNTTIYGHDDRYRGVKAGRRVVLVHADDIAALGLVDGDHVDLVSEWPARAAGSGGDARAAESGATAVVERRAPDFRVVAYPTARGCAAAYFPETNVLVPLDSTAETSNTPTSKSIIVRLEPR